MLEIVSKIAVD